MAGKRTRIASAAAAMGRVGGAKTSAAKKMSSRINALKGSRAAQAARAAKREGRAS